MTGLVDERGMVAVFVAFFLVAALGFGAIVIDVGALYQERRELQNGADAGALAVANNCAAAGCGDYTATAESMADANAADLASDVAEVCGTAPGLSACSDPPSVPAVAKYVRVTTSTRDAGSGGDKLIFGLARIFGVSGSTLRTASTVAYGPPGPSSLAAPPLIFSMCEYYESVGGPEGADALPYWPEEPLGPVHHIYFHNTAEAGACGAGPSGADLAGGFGWLDTDGACTATTYQQDTDGDGVLETWVGDKTGVAVPQLPDSCDPDTWHDGADPIVLTLPFYDDTNGLTGTNGEYRIVGYASLVITGFRFRGNTWPSGFQCPEGTGSSSDCLRGHFVRTTVTGTEFGTVDLGTVMVKVIE